VEEAGDPVLPMLKKRRRARQAERVCCKLLRPQMFRKEDP
jgi:hypothetical protein